MNIIYNTRPSFTVEVRNTDPTRPNISYCADVLQSVRKSGDWKTWCVAFICSGFMMEVKADQIVEIRFHPGGAQPGATWCSHCDNPLTDAVTVTEEKNDGSEEDQGRAQ